MVIWKGREGVWVVEVTGGNVVAREEVGPRHMKGRQRRDGYCQHLEALRRPLDE
jgi:hypothetical protein